MIDRLVYDWAPLVTIGAVAAFVVDWTLTHVGARASTRVRDRWAIEGRYELNPTWQNEVDAGQRFSWRMVGAGVALAAVLLLMRWVVGEGELDPALFAFASGAVLLIQAPILMAHAQNLQMFRDLADTTALTGSVTFSRWLTIRQAAWHLVRFAVLWLALWAASQQAFFLGGVLSCLTFARRLARLESAARKPGVRPSPPPPQPGS